MKLNILAKQAKQAIANNSPTILTALGVTGTLTVAYLTGRASFKAADIIRTVEIERELNNDPKLDNWDKVDLVWQQYVPAAGVAAMTVASIIGANHISTKRVAAFASAYSMAEKGFAQYKDKVLEKVGEKKEREVRDEVARQQIEDHPLSKSKIIITGMGDHLCFDAHSGRYFQGDIEKVRSAVNDINFEIINNGYASVSDYWALLNIDPTDGSDDLGWNTDKKLECGYSSQLNKEGQPCLVVTFKSSPRPRFYSAY